MKKWQEIEFLDFKERQIRRRTQKSRAIQVKQEEEAPAASGLRFVATAAVFLVVISVGGFLYWQHMQGVKAADLARRTELAVTEVKGDVEFSTATTPFVPLKKDARMSESFTVKLGPGGRCSLGTALPGSRMVLIDKGQIEVVKPRAIEDEPDKIFFTTVVKQGTVMCEFRKGAPHVEIKSPHQVSVFGLQGLYKVVVDEKETVVLVREGRVKIEKTDKSKNGLVKVDERANISATGDWSKPEKSTTPETVWR